MAKVIGQTAGQQITHKECGAVLEYHLNELRTLWSGKDISGGADGAKGFTCPNCGKDVIVERW